MVTSKVGKRHAFTGFEALKELFISRSVLLSIFSSVTLDGLVASWFTKASAFREAKDPNIKEQRTTQQTYPKILVFRDEDAQII